ncbi:hypothetical protein OG613_01160 [Streptomyces sp. NBC_00015]|uniref:hypothetical protein n=1 Tax=Streptomyces sp. NBC_00015 TaxID=2903611 RepID=UPI00324E0A34
MAAKLRWQLPADPAERDALTHLSVRDFDGILLSREPCSMVSIWWRSPKRRPVL